ncbi:hypothetical protein ACFX2I_014453 [Malus domestica]
MKRPSFSLNLTTHLSKTNEPATNPGPGFDLSSSPSYSQPTELKSRPNSPSFSLNSFLLGPQCSISSCTNSSRKYSNHLSRASPSNNSNYSCYRNFSNSSSRSYSPHQAHFAASTLTAAAGPPTKLAVTTVAYNSASSATAKWQRFDLSGTETLGTP